MLNKVTLIGNLGADPESKSFPDGGMITNITLATSRRWKDRETKEQKEEAEWHRVTFHNRQAEIAAEYLQKGAQVYIEGRIKTRKWQDNDGKDRYSTEIIATHMNMLGKKSSTAPSSNRPPQDAPPPVNNSGQYFDDDVPFNSLNSLIKSHLI